MKSKTILMTAFAMALSMAVSGMAQVPAAKPADPAKSTSSKKVVAAAPSASEIADAKAKGLVWVNTKSKVYHKDGASFGTTKAGKFMTEDDAKKAGFRAAKEPTPKKAKPVANTK